MVPADKADRVDCPVHVYLEQALGDRSSEKDLRERFVRTLNAQEDRLEQIDQAIKEHAAARDGLREQMHALLADLEYETAV